MTGHHVSFTVTGSDQEAVEQAAFEQLKAYADTNDHIYLRRCLANGTIRAYPMQLVATGRVVGRDVEVELEWEAEVEVELE